VEEYTIILSALKEYKDNRFMSRKFMKRPLVIEAFRYGFDDWPSWMDDEPNKVVQHLLPSSNKTYLLIRTLEGTMHVNIGDYVIKGIKGELYPCKSDIFIESYEEVYRE